jgi:hypothetical protein
MRINHVRPRRAIQTDISISVLEYVEEVGQYLQNLHYIAEPFLMKILRMYLRLTRLRSSFKFFRRDWSLVRWVWVFFGHVANNNDLDNSAADQARQSATQ